MSISSCKWTKSGLNQSDSPKQPWEDLLDKDLNNWEPFIGIPYKTVGIEGYKDNENIYEGTPLGLGNHQNIFSTFIEGGEVILKVSGEIFASLMSKQEYENYHLKLQVKWGDKRWEPRLNALANNGLLYHSVGEPGGGLWNTWMSSLELEIEHTNFGDFIAINDINVKARCPSVKIDDKYYYDPDAPLQNFGWKRFETGRCFKSKNLEEPMGEWTTVELICYKDLALHLVDGEVVMAVYEPRYYNGEEWIPMNKGKLQLQSEGAETYFKNIQIKSIENLEKRFGKFVKE